MRRVFLLLTFIAATACGQNQAPAPARETASTSSDACAHDATTFRCVKYLKNYDADTVTVQIPGVHPLLGEKISVRVRHIDAPEIKGKLPCEKEAARIAQRLVENQLKRAKRIDLKNVDRDKYFRVLADIEVDGKNLKAIVEKNHLSVAYEGGTKQKLNWCSRLGQVKE